MSIHRGILATAALLLGSVAGCSGSDAIATGHDGMEPAAVEQGAPAAADEGTTQYARRPSTRAPRKAQAQGWSPQRELSDRATTHGPALAEKDGVMCMAWAGTDAVNPVLSAVLMEIWVSISKDGGATWSPQKGLTIPGVDQATSNFATDSAPALTVIDGKFVMAWDGLDQAIYVSDSTDGLHWSAQRPLGQVGGSMAFHGMGVKLASSGGLAVMGGSGYVTNNLWVSTSRDGVHWTKQTPLGDRSGSIPGLAWGGGTFAMAWQGSGQSNIWVSVSKDGIHWSPQQELNDRATAATPALAYSPALGFYMAWEGLVPFWGRSANIWVSSSKNGLQWTPQQELGDRATHSGPALGPTPNSLFMAWQGGGFADNHIWTSFYQR